MAKKSVKNTESLSQQKKIALVVGIPLIILVVVLGVHFLVKGLVDDYAKAQEFPTYPHATLKQKIDPACQGAGDAISTERCITTVYCTKDSVGDVIDYFEDSVELEPAPEFFGAGAYYAIRESNTLDDIVYFLAGRSDGELLITMSVGDNQYYTDPYDCPDQTVIVSTVAWNTP